MEFGEPRGSLIALRLDGAPIDIEADEFRPLPVYSSIVRVARIDQRSYRDLGR